MSPFTCLIKNNYINKFKFSSWFTLLKMVMKNRLSKYFWASLWDRPFLTKKRSFQWISPKMLQNNRKHSLAVYRSLWCEKELMLIYFWLKREVFSELVQNASKQQKA